MPATEKSTIVLITELTKWKLSLAVAFSAVTGYLVFNREADAGLAMVATGVFLLSSGAAALNQYTERESDAIMARTTGRPLPSGRMRPLSAVGIAGFLLASGSLLLGFSGPVPLLLGLVNVLLYNLIYTGLKKRTALSIIPGALVGAVPPLIGYTAAGGAMTDTLILLFALFMFLWQMPHFWLLLLRYGGEYEQAGIRTFCGSMTSGSINRMVLLWITGSSLLLWLLTGLFLPFSTPVAVIMLALNISFIIAFRKIIRVSDTERMSKNAFILINSFSLVIMIILIVTS
ncbi:protoheme IX farnesyltransferase [bacterium]|nr:protoheme IX farnesyltransferase [bacterium]